MTPALLLSVALVAPMPMQQPSADPCVAVAGPYVIASASSYRILFTLPSTTTDTAGNIIPNPPKSFLVQIDATPYVDMGLPPAGSPCPAGSPYAGYWPFTILMPNGVAKGNHSAGIKVLYDSLDASGLPIVVESAAVVVPFVAVDPTRAIFPPIFGGRIIK